MTFENFDYEIDIDDLVPPIGGELKYVAKVAVITEHVKNQVRFHKPNLGEVWGKTKEEARDKMDDAVTKWILRFKKR